MDCIVELSVSKTFRKQKLFLCLSGKLIVGLRVCKSRAEVSEKRKIWASFSVVSVENKCC